MKHIILILLAALLCLTGCSAEEKMTYHPISQEEARQKMALDGNQIIVDVRRQDTKVKSFHSMNKSVSINKSNPETDTFRVAS